MNNKQFKKTIHREYKGPKRVSKHKTTKTKVKKAKVRIHPSMFRPGTTVSRKKRKELEIAKFL